MKKISILLLLSLSIVCGVAFAQKAQVPTHSPPSIACTDTELAQIANKIIAAAIKNTPATADINGFVTGGISISGDANSNTGLAGEIIYPYSVVNHLGQPVGMGHLIMNGKCEYQGGALEIHPSPLPVINLD